MDIFEEIKELRNKIDDIERKCMFITDYDLITALLKKLNIDKIEITKEEVKDTHAYYVVERTDDKYIIKDEGV